jgi:nucleotide-binding universal stress UspA family protein
MITSNSSLFFRILVAVDSSNYTRRTFEYAIQLARVINAKVFVVHVVQNPAVTAEAFILETAKKFNVNMIVIGSRGLSQIKELLLGPPVFVVK